LQKRFSDVEAQFLCTIEYNTISFIADDKNQDREVSAYTAGTETYMMVIIKI